MRGGSGVLPGATVAGGPLPRGGRCAARNLAAGSKHHLSREDSEWFDINGAGTVVPLPAGVVRASVLYTLRLAFFARGKRQSYAFRRYDLGQRSFKIRGNSKDSDTVSGNPDLVTKLAASEFSRFLPLV